MTRRFALTLALSLLASPALAEDLDFSKITCKQFLAAPKDEIGTILVWLEGYYTKEDAPPVMFDAKTTKDAKGLAAYCVTHDDDDIIKAAETVMPVK